MAVMNARHVVSNLKKKGFVEAKPGIHIPLNYVTVDGKIKSRHTANAIMKQAGIKKHF